LNTQEIILNGDEDNQSNELDEISILRDFGLEEDEAQTYVGLARLGSAKASEISTFTKIERVRTYKILESLKNLGFATSTLSSPIKFSANDPETILKNIITKQKQKIENLEKNSSKFLKILSKLKLNESEVETPKLTIVSNRDNIYDQIIKILDETNDEIHIVLAPSDLIRMYYTPVKEVIKNALHRKVIIKLMTDEEIASKREYVQRLGIKYFKIATLPTSGRLICNKSQVLMSGNTSSYSDKNRSEESVMVTNSKDIVRNMQSLCKFLWETGKGVHIENKQNKKENSQKQSTILVVDDDPDAVNIFSEYLEIKGITTVERCTDSKKAMDVFKKIRPEAVFLDIMMPDIDGFHLLDEIRKIEPKTKVIMVTADMSAATKKKIQEVKPTDVIYKPYDIKQIMRCLE